LAPLLKLVRALTVVAGSAATPFSAAIRKAEVPATAQGEAMPILGIRPCVRQYKLDDLDKGDRSRPFTVMDNLPLVEESAAHAHPDRAAHRCAYPC
jgi:hypothetical protein